MKDRKKLKIAATLCNQLGKEITEVIGSEEPEKKREPKQKTTSCISADNLKCTLV